MTQGNDSNQAETTQLSVEANVHLTAVLMALTNAGLYFQILGSQLLKYENLLFSLVRYHFKLNTFFV